MREERRRRRRHQLWSLMNLHLPSATGSSSRGSGSTRRCPASPSVKSCQ
ncbi:hypothetical protein EYF80_056076 [Liparis tanakae]|uniref:Uncharacterized protein n=1 Tax=Liparis tanakae TaxID=230148 RepID=A0A4Z2EXT6_9TELE|nr:hypothetical protein EYF80_056076 [Liparis tanakae]